MLRAKCCSECSQPAQPWRAAGLEAVATSKEQEAPACSSAVGRCEGTRAMSMPTLDGPFLQEPVAGAQQLKQAVLK